MLVRSYATREPRPLLELSSTTESEQADRHESHLRKGINALRKSGTLQDLVGASQNAAGFIGNFCHPKVRPPPCDSCPAGVCRSKYFT